MGRILFFVLLAVGVFFLIKSLQRKSLGSHTPKGGKQVPPVGRNTEEEIRPCEHCGAYSPISSGLMIQGRYYCGSEHARLKGESLR